MATGHLDAGLTPTRLGEGSWSARADPDYESANGMFGGWTAALALRAVAEAAGGPAHPSALTINFLSRIAPGTELRLSTRCAGAGRSVSHWQCELASPDGQETFATASVVLTERRDTDHHVEAVMPEAAAPETIEAINPAPGSAGSRMTVRPIVGFPPFGNPDTTSIAWVRETSGRAMDHLQLAFLADHRPPRSWYWSDGPRLSATLTMTTYFHATDEELAEVGDDEVLSEAFGVRGVRSTSEEHLRLWSRTGVLLATSIQLDWYR